MSPWKHRSYYIYKLCLNIKKFCHFPQSIFICFVWFSQKTMITAHSHDWNFGHCLSSQATQTHNFAEGGYPSIFRWKVEWGEPNLVAPLERVSLRLAPLFHLKMEVNPYSKMIWVFVAWDDEQYLNFSRNCDHTPLSECFKVQKLLLLL